MENDLNNEGLQGAEEQQTENKTFTQEEVLRLIQSEADKRVQQALSTQQKKYEKELQKQKSLSGLDAEARAKAESEQKIADLEEQLQQYRLANTKAEISKVLGNRGLDANLVDFIVTSDNTDECLEKIETLEKIFKSMVKREVDIRLKGNSPKTSTVGLEGNITKEQFKNMTIAQQSELARNNRKLYDELTKR